MICPKCGSNQNHVVDSRPYKNDQYIKRRRECLKCGELFNTYESDLLPDSIPDKVADELISLLVKASNRAGGKKIKISVEDKNSGTD